MAFFFMEESLPIRDEILKVSDLWVIHCWIIDFRDDTVPQGEPDSAGSRVSGSQPVFISVGPSRLDARPSESSIAGFWFHFAPPWQDSILGEIRFIPPLPDSSGLECIALGRDARHQFVPRLDERSCPFVQKLCCQGVDVNARLRELGQHLVGTPRQGLPEIPMIGKGF